MIAPEFPAHLEWLNTDRKFSINDLAGKFILLDFWTYCCINCMHVMAELKKLEEKYPELVVIGVHSAKFNNEKIKENICQAILRYDIEHPIIIDNNFEIWKNYGVNAWPSFILIGPDRQIIGKASGEGIFDRLDAVMSKLISTYLEAGNLNRERMQFTVLKRTVPETFLRFPGKIDVDSISKRLFISDSSHNRIIVANSEGEVSDIIGSGEQGRTDGSFSEASFFRPQGVAFDLKRNSLYVADTENHLIRKADLKDKIVTTISGSGEKGSPRQKGGKGSEVSLNSPWDLTILGKHLYIAMAGSHQLWRMNLDDFYPEVYAGSGIEGLLDGPRLSASLAQPSGITTDGKAIYFADSEVSAIRVVEEDVVTTLIGKGLFIFGDIDGPFSSARLQHPIGVHYHDNALYVADSYNHKIKKIDLGQRVVTTLAGTGSMGRKDGDALSAGLNEPNDVAVLDGIFYIADTNNHAIRVCNPETGSVSTISFETSEKQQKEKAIELTERSILPESKGIYFQLMLPEGYHWNEDADQQVSTISENPNIIAVSAPKRQDNDSFSYYIPIEINNEGSARLKIEIVGYYCDRESQCCFKPIEFNLPLRIERNASPGDITVVYKLSP
ncbi:MAG: thioredoxin-like domain-containing protein [Methanotrichaceae archaeon]